MGKQSEYWRAREKAALEQNQKKEKTDYDRQLAEIYQQMMDDCDADIQKFYARYAKKEGITLAEAKKRADKLDIEAYGRKAERYVRDKDFSNEANEEMRLYNMTMKVNRLELLKSELSLEMTAGSDGFQKMMARILPERTKDSYERQAGVLGMSIPDAETYESMVDSIVNGSFHNATWSQRVWANQEALRSQVNTLLVRGLIGGKNPRVLARDLAKSIGAGLKNAERLMRTELARVQIGAQQQAISDAGYSSYKFLAVGSACEDCLALDGKTFKLDKMVPGENAPPMHPNCRCSVCAAMSDEEFRKLTGVDPVKLDLKAINQAAVEKYKAESNNEIKSSGGVYGAYNDKNDPDYRKREKIGRDLYTEITNRKKSFEIRAVSKNSGLSIDEVSRIYDHLFVRKHLLANGTKVSKFDPDYYMAHSWIRVREGKNIQAHDLTMLYHELEEEKIMGESLEVRYEMAHNKAQKKFNYAKELQEYLKTHDA